MDQINDANYLQFNSWYQTLSGRHYIDSNTAASCAMAIMLMAKQDAMIKTLEEIKQLLIKSQTG